MAIGAAAAAIKAGDAFVEIGTTIGSAFHQGLGTAERKLMSWGKGLSIAGAAITGPAVGAIVKYVQFADEIAKLARRTGFSVKAVGELGYVATLAGQDLNSLERSVRRMQGAILDAGDGLADTVRQFEKLGIEVSDLKDLSPEEQFLKIGAALAALPDDTVRAGVAQRLFGRSGTGLLPMFSLGADAIAEYRKQFAKLVGLTAKSAKMAEDAADAWSRFKYGLLGVGMAVAEPLVEDLLKLEAVILGGVIAIRQWVSEHPGAVRWIAKLGVALLKAGAAMVGLAMGAKLLGVLLSPSGMIAAAVAGLLYLLDSIGVIDLGWQTLIDDIAGGNQQMAEWFKQIGSLIQSVFTVAWESVKIGFEILILEMKALWFRFLHDLAAEFLAKLERMNSLIPRLGFKTATIKAVLQLPLDIGLPKLQTDAGGTRAGIERQIEEKKAELGKVVMPDVENIKATVAEISRSMRAVFTEGIDQSKLKELIANWKATDPDKLGASTARLGSVSSRALAAGLAAPAGGFGAAFRAGEGARFETSIALSEKAASEQTARQMLSTLRGIEQNTSHGTGVYG